MYSLTETIKNQVETALQEDIESGDITAQLIQADTQFEVQLICREQATLCGTDWFNLSFLQLDSTLKIKWNANDGDTLQADQTVCTISGNARAILSAERTALNFLQTLSSTASITRFYQNLISETPCRILDTRKTIPNLRLAQKYAVRCGGGLNHRTGLYDAYLLKENHLAACGDMAIAVQQARQLQPKVLLEVEVENLQQLEQAIECKVDRVLLDNFTLDMLHKAVKMNNSEIQLEASGDITEENILQVAKTGVDFISIGALTKHIRAIDFSLRFVD
ncbi:MAG: carboxylating nicotinate-nucleotide diphosphorylase [Gammaproteobacteria bacterium]|jgi:nicotinate-nucleotide pyrophosphorylase (carboxylating)|nr:carboxylating nicotinate-nucleotide diphosphorylase [Gammaproteobacteria bacterium]MBT3721922.1 carboxylating nicotinate-nucleotide diphosphorylase [Gammaproteobacteria bacterium]MBT4076991.1 carboxylating nicotinate-nucleotide diphosphorylase [Gammaproteobacteria bacterium]MBT4196044.1 carboxylating nicotinate-nucleotide diphosphorylase [Gammaproteobacteria bacterium]MBT4451654.1 carboxylating nicotinate-nucleotide diphosphorylase [Gammaproteobacteria bacterium]